jgi:regulatory protein
MENARIITALKAQIRHPDRISVYLDGEFAFGLARIIAAWLRIGEALSDEKIEQLRKHDSLEKAHQAALHLLSYRPRAENEIQRKLVEKGYSEEECDAVMERLRQAGLVGDGKFAQQWVDNRLEFRPRGRRMVTAELRQKGVADEEIEQALSGLPDEETLAYDAAVRAARKLEGQDWETFRKRLAGHLARKGFTYETIAPVLRKVWEETREQSRSKNKFED